MDATVATNAVNKTVSPTSINVADAARLLSVAGGRRVTEEQIAADIESGAPVNADGAINLVYYASWLIREMAKRGGD